MTEILAPAGDRESAYAAINAGADAIYLGLNSFSARSSAANFGKEELSEVIAYSHFFGVKVYVAMNTLVRDEELPAFVSAAVDVHNMGADAIIIQDIYLGAYLKKTYPEITLHLSTQAGVCNVYGAEYAKKLGFSRVILARETAFEDIKKIASVIETEVFVQGALCTCFSGQCYLSSFAGGNSGNRGRCKQPCRKRYKIDRCGVGEFAYRLSLSDLCVAEDIHKLAEAGVSSFKIEGRMRRSEYVSAAVGHYRSILGGGNGNLSALKRTYNRGNYTKGLAFGQPKGFISSAVQGHIGEYVGCVFVENGKYVVKTSERFSAGDGFKILRGGKELCGATFAENVKGGMVLNSSVRLKNGDKAFITTDVALNAGLLSVKRKHKITISARFAEGEAPEVILNGIPFTADFIPQRAASRPLNKEDVISCFLKTDTYPYMAEFADIVISGSPFIPKSALNEFRRAAYSGYFKKLSQNKNKQISLSPLPGRKNGGRNYKVCVISEDFSSVKADVAVLKPREYEGNIFDAVKDFAGEKYLYLPPYLSGEEIERIKPLITPFDGIYCGGNYAVELAAELNKNLFAGTGFNLFNYIAVGLCPAKYKALSKELTSSEAALISDENTFYLGGGDIQVMDLIYCPFSKTCSSCDRRSFYVLTDEEGRNFPLRRYKTSQCRFEVYNMAALSPVTPFTGVLKELTLPRMQTKYTFGHSKTPVL